MKNVDFQPMTTSIYLCFSPKVVGPEKTELETFFNHYFVFIACRSGRVGDHLSVWLFVSGNSLCNLHDFLPSLPVFVSRGNSILIVCFSQKCEAFLNFCCCKLSYRQKFLTQSSHLQG